MPDVWAAGIGAASSILGGATKNSSSAKAAQKANDFNERMTYQNQVWNAQQAASARDFEAAQAEKQMEFQNVSNAKQMSFQERMSSTAHQREVNDLRAAGLNPILSGTGGMGSSSPVGASSGGSMARGQQAAPTATPAANVAQVVDYLTPAIASAVSVGQVVSSINKQTAETKDIESQINFRETSQKGEVDSRIILNTIDAGLKGEQASLTSAQREKVPAEIQEILARGKAHIASAQQSAASASNLTEKTRSERVEAAASEWAQEYGIPKIKKALEVAGIGAEAAKDIAFSISSLFSRSTLSTTWKNDGSRSTTRSTTSLGK